MSEIITIDDDEDDVVIDDSIDDDVIQLSDSDNDDIQVEEVMFTNDVEFAGFHYNNNNKYIRRRRHRRKNRLRDETINKSGSCSGVKPKQEVTVHESQESSNTESEVEVETIETNVSQSVPQTNPLNEVNEVFDRTLVEENKENQVFIEDNNEEILDTNIEEINETLTETNDINANILETEVLVSTDSLAINETNVSDNFMPKIENQINDKIEKLVLENTVENELNNCNDSETTDVEENILSLNIVDQIETNDFNNNHNSKNIIIAGNNLEFNKSLDCNDTENQNINNDVNEAPIDTNDENEFVDENEDNYEIESLEDLDIGPKYPCSWNECGVGFDEAFDHYMHEKKHLRDAQKKGIKTFKCSKCEFSAFNLIDLTFHNTEHLNRYLCRLDNCRFQTNSQLKLDIHSKKHKTGKCNECIALSACDCGELVCRRKKYKSSKTQIYKSYKLY